MKLGAECELGGFSSFANKISPKGKGVVLKAAGEVLEVERGGSGVLGGVLLGGLEEELDELGDGRLEEGSVEGGVEVGFGELDVEIEGNGGEEFKGFTSEDLGEVEVDVGADELEGAQVDAFVDGGLGGEVYCWYFAAEDAAIAGLDFEREGVEMVGLGFEPEADGGDEYFADETGAACGVGNAIGGGIGHGEVDFWYGYGVFHSKG